ncbi:MAG: glycoside hydrolase family 172 protein [Cyclobacteriaceae bacterium]
MNKYIKQIGIHTSFVVFAMLISCTPKEKVVTVASLLQEMLDRDVITRFPEQDFRLKQASSYNRESVTPEDSTGWFKNRDFNANNSDLNFIRIEENNGQKEWVLMDHHGAGAIVRTWMPFRNPKNSNTNSIIKFYLDGASEPTLEGNMLDLLNGSGQIPFPLAHKSLRSAVSFFPIPYAQSCKITVTERPFFYQFTYREYEQGTRVETFTREFFAEAEPLINQVCESLQSPADPIGDQLIELKDRLEAGEERTLILPKGTSAVEYLSIKLGNYADSMLTRTTILKIDFDDQQTVWSPIGDFFGSGIGFNPFQGWYRTVDEKGKMSCRWVMPYQKSAKVSILNLGDQAIDVDLQAKVRDYHWDGNSLYFNAVWRGEYPVPTRPFSDWNYVILKGRGVYVGDALTIMNPVKKWWGEGDEKIWVDGEDFPSIFGTGTEDYYGYSWGGISTDFYEHPFHAQPRAHVYNKLNRKTNVEERNTLGYSTETRTRSLDVMPFGTSLQLDMEVWSWTDCDMAYGVGMYWYGDASTISNRVPDPNEVVLPYKPFDQNEEN